MENENLKQEKQCAIHTVSVSSLCKGCIRDIRGLQMNDGCIHGKWASPYEQKLFAAKCPEGSCKHDKQ